MNENIHRNLMSTPSESDTLTLKSDLRRLALDDENRSAFVTGCTEAILSGEPLFKVVHATQGTGWRFILTNSGQSITVEHVDVLIESYSKATTHLESMRDRIGWEKYADWITEAVEDCYRAHQRMMSFVTKGDRVPDVKKDVFRIFDGTGYRYNYRGIIPEHEDDDFEEE